jgi:hypothetical protein
LISVKNRKKDSLKNVYRDFNLPVRSNFILPSAKGYRSKNLSPFADIHIPDTLHKTKDNTIFINFFEPNISKKATPIKVLLIQNKNIQQIWYFELKQFNKLRIDPRVKPGKFSITTGVYFHDEMEGEYPNFYSTTKELVIY